MSYDPPISVLRTVQRKMWRWLIPPAVVASVLVVAAAASPSGGAKRTPMARSESAARVPPFHCGTRLVRRATTLAPGTQLRSDKQAARLVLCSKWEPKPRNRKANHTVPTGRVSWNRTRDELHWRKWIQKRRRVTGNFTGTTNQILQWAAFKWGLDGDVLRAVAVQESDWNQSEVGDGGESFGIMQVKDHTSDGNPDFGGYPWTLKATALNVDFYAAWIRACFNGDFYDGSDWLYGGKKVTGDLWGCVGAWFSGDWYDGGARDYISQVKGYFAEKPWRHWH